MQFEVEKGLGMKEPDVNGEKQLTEQGSQEKGSPLKIRPVRICPQLKISEALGTNFHLFYLIISLAI